MELKTYKVINFYFLRIQWGIKVDIYYNIFLYTNRDNKVSHFRIGESISDYVLRLEILLAKF